MKLLHYNLIILLNCALLYAQEEPVKKVPDDPTIKNIIGLLYVSTSDNTNTNSEENTIKAVDSEPNSLFQAVQWATTEYPRKFELILWNHGAYDPILWDRGYRTSSFQKNDFSHKKNDLKIVK